ncbi:hypothetical protein M1432_02360 [Patescibacteria group bacterium]|nr:hypothetical protein [Patescibacteria group bacterium]
MTYSDREIKEIFNGILGADFRLKSEESSCILKALDGFDEETKPTCLAYVLSHFGTVKKNNQVFEGEGVSDRRYTELVEKIGRTAMRVLHDSIAMNPTPEDLAAKIQKFLDGLKKDEERSVALALILNDRHIPYCQIPAESIERKAGLIEGMVEEEERTNDGAGPSENRIQAKILTQNIMNRGGINPATGLVLWDLIDSQDTEADKFAIFYGVLRGIQESDQDNMGGIAGILGMMR